MEPCTHAIRVTWAIGVMWSWFLTLTVTLGHKQATLEIFLNTITAATRENIHQTFRINLPTTWTRFKHLPTPCSYLRSQAKTTASSKLFEHGKEEVEGFWGSEPGRRGVMLRTDRKVRPRMIWGSYPAQNGWLILWYNVTPKVIWVIWVILMICQKD